VIYAFLIVASPRLKVVELMFSPESMLILNSGVFSTAVDECIADPTIDCVVPAVLTPNSPPAFGDLVAKDKVDS
jgi:hypothetical protein